MLVDLDQRQVTVLEGDPVFVLFYHLGDNGVELAAERTLKVGKFYQSDARCALTFNVVCRLDIVAPGCRRVVLIKKYYPTKDDYYNGDDRPKCFAHATSIQCWRQGSQMTEITW